MAAHTAAGADDDPGFVGFDVGEAGGFFAGAILAVETALNGVFIRERTVTWDVGPKFFAPLFF
jgi:hypothetical protein